MCGGAQGGSPCLWKAVGGLGVGWWVMRSFDGSFGRDRRSGLPPCVVAQAAHWRAEAVLFRGEGAPSLIISSRWDCLLSGARRNRFVPTGAK